MITRTSVRFRAAAAACLLWLLLALSAAPAAFAAESGIFYSSGTLSREAPGDAPGLYLNASFSINLPSQAEESLKRGVALYFVTEFSLSRKRWYWSNRDLASASFTKRLTYSLLTRKYHVGGDGLSLSFATLEEALSTLTSVRSWRVADASAIGNDFQSCTAQLRLSLDKNRLPRPLQLGASDWDVTSDWVTVPISPAVAAP